MTDKVYEAWSDPEGVMLCRSEHIRQMERLGRMHPEAKLLYSFTAASGEEAGAIHHLRQGLGAYYPIGEAEPCPECGANFYPYGSGECWQCG